MVPTDRKYTREHDWVLIEDGVATLGITDHAQSELGDIVYVELPEVDSEINLGESYTTVESVKAKRILLLHWMQVRRRFQRRKKNCGFCDLQKKKM